MEVMETTDGETRSYRSGAESVQGALRVAGCVEAGVAADASFGSTSPSVRTAAQKQAEAIFMTLWTAREVPRLRRR